MPRGGGGGGGAPGRGRKKNHKGQRRMFTDEEDLKQQAEKDEKAKAWRRQCGIESSDEEEEKDKDKDKEGAGAKNRDLPPSGSSSEESSDEEDAKPSGVSHLIQVSNPNRSGNKAVKKVTELGESSATLSRREREELEKQEAKRRYQALHAAGKTDEAQADLARLSIIRKQREEAAKKREEEKKEREEKEAAASKAKGKS